MTVTSKRIENGDHLLTTICRDPLYISELRLVPIDGLGGALGNVKAGTPGNPAPTRTIYLDSAHGAFNFAAPPAFTLPITYATENYVVSKVGAPTREFPPPPFPLFDQIAEELDALTEDKQIEFVTRVIARVSPGEEAVPEKFEAGKSLTRKNGAQPHV